MAKSENVSAWRLVVADCVKYMQALPEQSAALVFADPPFNVGYDYDVCKDDKQPENYLAWCKRWIAECHRVLAADGTFWIAIGDEYVSELDVLAKQLGFHKRSHVIWYVTFGVNCAKNFARSHTHLLYFTKHKSKFLFNAAEPKLRVPSSRQLVYKDPRANPNGKLPDNTWVLSPLDLAKAFSPTEDTWLESRVCGTFNERVDRGEHGERRGVPQMPIKVLERIVLACSKPGDLVLDPMCATGTTGVAAVLHGRRFQGCDISRAYIDSAQKRLTEAKRDHDKRTSSSGK